MRWVWMSVFMLVSACGPTSGGSDAGDPDGQFDAGGEDGLSDAGDPDGQFDAGGEDGLSDAGDLDGQFDAGGEDGWYDAGEGDDGLLGWTLSFPAGLQLCGWNAMVRHSPPYAPFDHKVRLTLREAAVDWPQGQESLQVDLLDRVEVGPDGAAAAAVGPGLLEARTYTGGQQTWIGFDYIQEFNLAGRPIPASFGFFLRDTQTTGEVEVADLFEGEHNTCGLSPGQTEGKVTATAANGDVVVFDYRYILSFLCPPGMACLTPYGLGDPDRGEFTRGADQRVVTNYFRLGLDCVHHGGPNRFIMIFDAPLNGVHGVTLAPQTPGGFQYDITYLDENLALSDTAEVTNLQWTDPGHP